MSTKELIALKKEVKQQIDHADERVVRMVHALLDADINANWVDTMPHNIHADLLESIAQADKGEVISHEDVKKRHPQWFSR